jgi:hypothetical protein
VQATTTRLGRSTGIHLECRTHHNVSEKGDRVARPETLPDWHLRCRCPSVPVMQTADSLLRVVSFVPPDFLPLFA